MPPPRSQQPEADGTRARNGSAPDAESLRRMILARLTRLQCYNKGGCTRSCRRQRRCVVADAMQQDAPR